MRKAAHVALEQCMAELAANEGDAASQRAAAAAEAQWQAIVEAEFAALSSRAAHDKDAHDGGGASATDLDEDALPAGEPVLPGAAPRTPVRSAGHSAGASASPAAEDRSELAAMEERLAELEVAAGVAPFRLDRRARACLPPRAS